jgi:hypothetical protein
MANMALIRVKGKPETPYEGKIGVVRKAEWLENSILKTVIVLWDGEKEDEKVSRYDIEMVE